MELVFLLCVILVLYLGILELPFLEQKDILLKRNKRKFMPTKNK